MEACELCPRRCRVDRVRRFGFCGAGENLRVALVSLHRWEEPCLVGLSGAGTIFFSHCNLRCVFCQNFSISQKNFGAEISVERLAEIFFEQKNRGAANVELVTPTHYAEKICEAIDLAKARGFSLPIVWNSNAYENLETLELLRGRVDIFLPDLKYFDDEAAKIFSSAPNYFSVASAAVKKMFELVGAAKFSNGRMVRGMIVRHLILPNFRRDAMKIVDWLHENFGDEIFISLMNQYTPLFRAAEFKKISRALTTFEYDSVVEHAAKIGVKNCFVQIGKTADEKFIPNFDLSNVSNCSAGQSHDVSDSSTDERPGNRHPRVTPIGVTFSGDGQNCVSDSRPQITGGIHGVTCGAAERQTQRHDQDSDEIRSEPGRNCADGFAENHPNHEHQKERRDCLGEKVCNRAANGRPRCEDTEFGCGIGRL